MKYSEIEIKDKLLKEFISLDKLKNIAGDKVEAIVLFAAEETSLSGENKERIDEGIRLLNQLETKPTLLYLGTKNHNENAANYLESKNVKYDLISSHAQANTKDQIIDLKKYFKNRPIKSIIVISHLYHIPRIKRYCRMIIPNINVMFWKIGKLANFEKQVTEEIEKIIEYSKKEDLLLFL